MKWLIPTERRTVVYWRHFERFEEQLTQEQFGAVLELADWGDCYIESVGGKSLEESGWDYP